MDNINHSNYVKPNCETLAHVNVRVKALVLGEIPSNYLIFKVIVE